MPALLIENIRVGEDARAEYRIEIYLHEIEIILLHAARDRIESLIRICHSVEECVHRRLEKLDERLLDRIFVRAAEHRVLKYVEDTSIVLRQSPESYREELVLLAALCPYEAGACPVVFHLDETAFEFLDIADPRNSESVHFVINI